MAEEGRRPKGDKRCPKCDSTIIEKDWEREVGSIYKCIKCGFSKGFDPSPFYRASKKYWAGNQGRSE